MSTKVRTVAQLGVKKQAALLRELGERDSGKPYTLAEAQAMEAAGDLRVEGGQFFVAMETYTWNGRNWRCPIE